MLKMITSESVNVGHPDKTCDKIADAFLDEALRQDKNSQMAVECAIKNDKLFIYGEATTSAKIDYEGIAKRVLSEIGYKNDFNVIKEISEQSPDIHQAVVKDELMSNDQGMVFGYACSDTPELMPLPIMIAHKIMYEYNRFRNTTKAFFADAKCQVTVAYNEKDEPQFIDTILCSVSHLEALSHEQIEKTIKKEVITKALKPYTKYIKQDIKYLINPSGRFTIWGSFGDSGCVGRKIIVDSYGGASKVGGGCFSSKNATKVDRSGAYYGRYVAKNIVARNFASKVEIEVAYAIGLSKPVSIYIETFGTEKCSIDFIYDFVNKNFDFSISNIIKELDLLKPVYEETACFGHFGRNEFSWEKIKEIQ